MKKHNIISNLKHIKKIQKNIKINLSKRDFYNFLNLALGYYHPLKGFCNYEEYISIITKNKFMKQSWSIPILLRIRNNKKIKINNIYMLSFQKKIVGVIKVNNIFNIDKKKYCNSIFNHQTKKHPAIKELYEKKHTFYLGGEVFILKSIIPKDKFFIFNQYKKNKNFYSKSCVFSSRNICHLGHQQIHKKILQDQKKLTICIIENDKNKYNINTILDSYTILKKKERIYKKIRLTKIFLPNIFAGPKEAHLQATIFNNLGFKFFVVGRDHAGFKNFFSKYAAQRYLKKIDDLQIKIINTTEPLLCKICGKVGFSNKKFCKCIKKNDRKFPIDGTKVKKLLMRSKFPDVSVYLNPIILNYCTKNIKKLQKKKT